ncbi:signal peptidase I [Catenuloplanes japonicus]|uniref:signal peptidase I n=1 Tax=Catenuloplanes japonicus TaxID=33876 RepID=UPI00052545C0|nr:signal peptidase I [Catenuloplanes japonicus]
MISRVVATAVLLVAAVVAVVLIRTFVAWTVTVGSTSMEPTLHRGDVVLIHYGRPGRGDLVAFTSPEDGALTIKRVVAVPGDTLEIRDAVLFVNDAAADPPFIDHASFDGTWFGPVAVPAGMLFVLGDNRAGSIDSRTYGPIPETAVRGRVTPLFQ